METTYAQTIETEVKLYSMDQVTVGSFLGGPLAAIYLLWKNFRALGDEEKAQKVLTLGGSIVVVFFVAIMILPSMPSVLSHMAPVLYSLLARHLTKEAIEGSKQQLSFQQSNWDVFVISIASALAVTVLVVVLAAMLVGIGLVK
jgi:hypothetical protein